MDVSIIIPTYNSAAYLRRAFDSAITQEGVAFEVIIVDNNSTDGTWQLMEQLQAAHPKRVRLSREPVQGSAAARNHGVRLARGEWLQFLDSDDVLLGGKLARQVGLGRSVGAKWVIGAFWQREIDATDNILSGLADDPWKGLAYNGGVGSTISNLFCSGTYRDLGGQRTELTTGEDNDYYFRLLKRGFIPVVDPEPSAIYLRRPLSLSCTSNRANLEEDIAFSYQIISWLRTNRPTYFSDNAGYFNAAALRSILSVFTHDTFVARSAMSRYLPGGIKHTELASDLLPAYYPLYKLFGVEAVETGRFWLKTILPKTVRKWLVR